MNIFRDQDAWTSEISVYMNFTNPKTNFFDFLTDYEKSFHVETYTFDLKTFSYMITDTPQYSDASFERFTKEARRDLTKYAKGIDKTVGDHLRPELKCNPPCYTCLDSNPDYCTSCWGVGPENNIDTIFLQDSQGKSTCKNQCDDKYTTNGFAVTTANKQGVIDETKTYYTCKDCDVTCGTCEG